MLDVVNTTSGSLHQYSDSVLSLLESLSREMSYVTGHERSTMVNDWLSRSKDYPVFLMLNENAVAGVCVLDRRSKTEIEISLLATRPFFRRQGIAKTLLDTACQFIQKTDKVTAIVLSVTIGNKTAIRLYEKSGFKRRDDNSIKMIQMVKMTR